MRRRITVWRPSSSRPTRTASLCADTTKVGRAETYLTVDVPRWIKAHLPVSRQARDWAIGGFSQGGTCATQLGPRHPDIFDSIIAVDGELKPTAGSVEHMVAEYFNGDRSAYEAQVPANAIADHAPSWKKAYATPFPLNPFSSSTARPVSRPACTS